DEYGKPTAYGVMKDDAEAADKTVMAEKHRAVMGQIKDRFDKSARGPATAILVRPATFLIAEGVIVFFAALGYAFWAIFPLVFEPRDNDSSKAGQIVAKKTDDQLREEWNDLLQERLLHLGAAVLIGIWGLLICHGGYKMVTLESYGWAMAGSIMGIVPLLIGLICLVTLKNPKVVAGFEEKAPEEV